MMTMKYLVLIVLYKKYGNEVTNVGFTVDAGLIQRLGYELVGRAETAVSELIKNSYDADATVVDVDLSMHLPKEVH